MRDRGSGVRFLFLDMCSTLAAARAGNFLFFSIDMQDFASRILSMRWTWPSRHRRQVHRA